MAAPLVAMLLLGGTYYLARLAPRIAQREAARQAALRTTRQHVKPYHRYEGGFENPMSQREALLLLGFQEDAAGGSAPLPSEDEVKANYYKLIRQLHSDVDGSTYIAAKLNEARDVLVKR
ncbi:hypothetical protein ERJ75_000425500 [Trypanosoma vivax]|uniref:J domain-containing protein n=1 Tax=Trypanosoma vivax (strain Y486) TaxID=1055687 RepID=G0U1M7_TRYVY|nr:hypothetical protein TRVL_00951 [Trypanosoma vivax]KAH8617035.1 hypothetical protein ERJ75_000425500 [Trypanosoma vivax]CCC49984.1 conserved hypothetical protein [Trypanosoma vivax Y486]